MLGHHPIISAHHQHITTVLREVCEVLFEATSRVVWLANHTSITISLSLYCEEEFYVRAP
jgi:hypothetical protein